MGIVNVICGMRCFVRMDCSGPCSGPMEDDSSDRGRY